MPAITATKPSPILIGMRGSGKSTVGQKLAEALQRPFIDADPALEQEVGMSIADIFRVHGQPWFRAQEEQVLARLMAQPELVLASGGGAVLHATARQTMSQRPTIWLTAPTEVLAQRIEGTDRPPLKEGQLPLVDELRSVLEERRELYRACAALAIETDNRSSAAIVAEICEFWRRWE